MSWIEQLLPVTKNAKLAEVYSVIIRTQLTWIIIIILSLFLECPSLSKYAINTLIWWGLIHYLRLGMCHPRLSGIGDLSHTHTATPLSVERSLLGMTTPFVDVSVSKFTTYWIILFCGHFSCYFERTFTIR